MQTVTNKASKTAVTALAPLRKTTLPAPQARVVSRHAVQPPKGVTEPPRAPEFPPGKYYISFIKTEVYIRSRTSPVQGVVAHFEPGSATRAISRGLFARSTATIYLQSFLFRCLSGWCCECGGAPALCSAIAATCVALQLLPFARRRYHHTAGFACTTHKYDIHVVFSHTTLRMGGMQRAQALVNSGQGRQECGKGHPLPASPPPRTQLHLPYLLHPIVCMCRTHPAQ